MDLSSVSPFEVALEPPTVKADKKKPSKTTAKTSDCVKAGKKKPFKLPDNVKQLSIAWFRNRVSSADLPEHPDKDTTIDVQYRSSTKYTMLLHSSVNDIMWMYTKVLKEHYDNECTKEAVDAGRFEELQKMIDAVPAIDEKSTTQCKTAATTTMHDAVATIENRNPSYDPAVVVQMTIRGLNDATLSLSQILKIKANKKKLEEKKKKMAEEKANKSNDKPTCAGKRSK